MSSKTSLSARIKKVWKGKVVGRFAYSDELDEKITLPTPGKLAAFSPGQSDSVNLDAFNAYYSYILQQPPANHVTFRETSRSSLGTHSYKPSPKIYLFLLTSALITVVNGHPPFLNQGPPGSALAELSSVTAAKEMNHHPAQSDDQQYGQPQPVRQDPGVQMMSEATVPANNETSDEKVGDTWVVPGVGNFSHKAIYTFNGSTLPEGLFKSDYPVLDSERYMGEGVPPIPYNHRFEPENVQIRNGSLFLRVPGRQRPRKHPNKEISSAQIETTETKILYASVRTRARFSRVPGTCHGTRIDVSESSSLKADKSSGIFFYSNDQHETDIEYLTDPRSLSNNGPDDPIPIWYSNQKRDPVNSPPSAETGPAPFDATSRVHEYRIDWTAEFTAFYIDGVLHKYLTQNVPSLPGPWLWNNWANGDKGGFLVLLTAISLEDVLPHTDTNAATGWSVGPPAKDNELEIKSIVMYYNTWTPPAEE